MSDSTSTVFVVDDDPGFLCALARLLMAAAYKTQTFTTSEGFLSVHDHTESGCAVLDVAGIGGLALQQTLRGHGVERPSYS